MADIKDQLIKDSYNYVLQSDLSTGVVYRIGGSIPVNPIFSSGLTINDSLVYSGAGEQNGYALLTDGTGYAYWGPVSAATPSSGISGNGTVNYISKWTGVTSIGNSIIYDNGTNIGIGTSSPTQKLTVSGNLLSTGIVFCTNTIASDSLQSNNLFPSDDLDLNISTRTDSGTKGINLMTGPKPGGLGYVRMKITSGGTVGINNEAPTALLDILTPTGSTIGFRVSGNSDTDMVRITQTGSGNAFVVEDSSNPDITSFVINSSGNVGIGTTTPSEKLQVSGNTIISSGLTANTISASTEVISTGLSVGVSGNSICAIIEIASTTQGVLFPRMTNTQRESIVSPVSGLFVYCTDSPEGLFMYKSTGWVQIM